MSFIPVSDDSHFPLENIPFGVFSTEDNVSNVPYYNINYAVTL